MSAPDGPSPLTWTEDGQPRSRLFGDVYFSAEDGLAESRAVFLAGCGLPDRWAGRRRFVVGELGFGTGLNILALLDLWGRARPPGGRLHVFTIEAHPLARAEAARALAAWPELSPLSDRLVAQWPGKARGFHRIELAELGAVIDVAHMEAAEALAAWTGRADAWFLDGFAPAANPEMWRQEVLDLVAARSAPGARAATFTVAGAVRRGLQAAGFGVDKRPGFGRKRERLEAALPGEAVDPAPRRVAIVGAGIAGASAARALRALGVEPLVIEAEAPGAGGSGNPAALVTPRLDAGLGPLAALFAQAWARAIELYEALPGAVISRGVLQLAAQPRDPTRFEKIAASDLFDPGALTVLGPQAASARLGEPAPVALDQAPALVIAPDAALAAWLGPVRRARVARLERSGQGWRLLADDGALIGEAEQVILCAGLASRALVPGLPLSAVRGQASWAPGVTPPAAAAWGGYVLPTRDGGALFGATHDREDEACDLRPGDHDRNLAQLRAALPGLAAQVDGRPLEGRASVRAVTPDRLPMAGPVAGMDGLHLLTGLGSRGFALAPLLAEQVAAAALGAPWPLPAPLAALVDPERFSRRAARGAGPGPR
ncbi:FAD-dependent 5-carboxymethylaminomethyl-2-thiouridine(34) oxidoreductase MnmC [Phenylobacterium terrae]|uniref:tRNA 5-methylaminomethyl-2-thiouridine biosynthesis bifunctional protein MnmC n=1 Tax=Phenylobacterium terrae TaxID=2665495 RepID=A0ABW4N2C3_9CAUL